MIKHSDVPDFTDRWYTLSESKTSYKIRPLTKDGPQPSGKGGKRAEVGARDKNRGKEEDEFAPL